VIPPANQKKLDFEAKFIRRSNPTITSYNMHAQVYPNIYFFIEYFNKNDKEGVNVTLEKFEDSKLISKLSAQTMNWDTTVNKWRLNNYVLREFSGDNEKLTSGQSIDTIFNLFPRDFMKSAKIIETMDFPELNQYIEEQKLSGTPDIINSLLEKHNRLASPFATFILTIIGFSLSIKKVRSGGLGLNIGIGLFLSFTYIFFMRFSSVLALNGGFDPILSSWIPNIIYAGIAIGIFFTIHE
jgi:lipopolysaccharide export system permease protein